MEALLTHFEVQMLDSRVSHLTPDYWHREGDQQPYGRFEFIADCGKPLPDGSRHGMTPKDFIEAHMQDYERKGSHA